MNFDDLINILWEYWLLKDEYYLDGDCSGIIFTYKIITKEEKDTFLISGKKELTTIPVRSEYKQDRFGGI